MLNNTTYHGVRRRGVNTLYHFSYHLKSAADTSFLLIMLLSVSSTILHLHIQVRGKWCMLTLVLLTCFHDKNNLFHWYTLNKTLNILQIWCFKSRVETVTFLVTSSSLHEQSNLIINYINHAILISRSFDSSVSIEYFGCNLGEQ